MLDTVRDLCEVHDQVLRPDAAPEIDDLLEALGEAASSDATADAFFRMNHVTGGMHLLLELVFRRLAGKTDQGSFVLSQAMGGGKTHTMIVVGLLARSPLLRRRILSEEKMADDFSGAAKVVAITGRRNPPHYLWGEIAAQLGRAEAFRQFWAEGPKAPDEPAWANLLGDEPILIMLDELPAWFDFAVTQQVGSGSLANLARYALANLVEAARKKRNVCVIASNLSGGVYPDATRDLREEVFRGARPIEPVSLQGRDIFEIMRKRLFKRLPDSLLATRWESPTPRQWTRRFGRARYRKPPSASPRRSTAAIRFTRASPIWSPRSDTTRTSAKPAAC